MNYEAGTNVLKAMHQAEADLREVEGKMAELEAQQDLLSEFLHAGRALLGIADGAPLPAVTPSVLLPPQAPMFVVAHNVAPPRSLKDRVTQACLSILADGFPMKPQELIKVLERRGVVIGGTNKPMALSAMLSKDGRFQPDRKRGWSLKSDPTPVGAGMGSGATQGELPDADSSGDEL